MSTLKIFTLTEKQDGTIISVPFPNEVEQAEICDYEYTANRMGGAPSLTAKISYSYPLDDLWNEKQYVEFNGVRLFVRDTPNGKIDNSTGRYEHEITFLHERFVLENVYMLDSVYTDGDNPDKQPDADKYVSNSTKVVFWGDINEFVSRFNACLLAANLGGKADGNGYYVVVDDGVKSDELLISFEDKYFSEALQEIYNTYKLPYYWEGKVCHIGTAPTPISEIFEYGEENALLSIEKTNTNQGYFNRATGTGSSDNVPYYYPRTVSPATTSPHAVEGNKGITDDNSISVVDEEKFVDGLEAVIPSAAPWDGFGIQYSGGQESAELQHIGTDIWTPTYPTDVGTACGDFDSKYNGYAYLCLYFPSYILVNSLRHSPYWWQPVYSERNYFLDATGSFLDSDIVDAVGDKIGLTYSIYQGIKERTLTIENYIKGWDYCSTYETAANAYLESAPREYGFRFNFRVKKVGDFCTVTFPVGFYRDGISQEMDLSTLSFYFGDENWRNEKEIQHKELVTLTQTYDSLGRRLIRCVFFDLPIKNVGDTFYIIVRFKPKTYKCWIPQKISDKDNYRKDIVANYFDSRAEYIYTDIPLGEVVPNGASSTIALPDGKKTNSPLEAWHWHLLNRARHNSINVGMPVVEAIPSNWHKEGSIQITDLWRTLEDYGMSSTQSPQDGDRIVRRYAFDEIENVPTQTVLMPTIYRDTQGKDVFYNALNATRLLADEKYSQYSSFYKDKEDEYYTFEHEYAEQNPREIKYSFADIRPTIEGIEGVNGPLNVISEVAFDYNDHDYTKEESLYKTGEDYSDELDSNSEYDHPYFFVKIHQTQSKENSDYSFNIFDSSTEEEMSLSLKSGDCGGCTFRIMVISDTKKNPVLTDGNGNLLRDEYGRVRLVGAKNQGGYGIDETQQDSRTNDIWLCLEKEQDTYGIIMPNVSSNFRPVAGDKFVLLNINLPLIYIREAEARLSRAIIEQMQKDNTEKYTFSINFSRIYLAENPGIAKLIDENACINIRYNGRIIPLYVSTYSVKQTNDNSLPDISVDLKDEISVSSGNSINRQTEISESLSSIGIGGGNGVTIIPTTDESIKASDNNVYSAKRTDRDFVSKNKDEEIPSHKNFTNGLQISNGLDVTGDTTTDNAYIKDYFQVGTYQDGLVGALRGMKVTKDGTIYAPSLRLENTLEVPAIEFNRAMVMDGIFIVSSAVGAIEDIDYEQKKNSNGELLYFVVDADDNVTSNVTTTNTGYPVYEEKGTAILKLERGECGAVKEGDMLLGFWHNIGGGNSSVTTDGIWNEQEQCYDRNGDFTLSGFCSVYFLVTKVFEGYEDSKKFEYELRSATDTSWQLNVHPQVGMKFYGFGNIQDKSRQSLYIITRDYSVRLINKHEWTYDASNVIEIHGLLEGFSMIATGKDGKPYTKRFHGYGNVEGNSYIFGQIDQFERLAYNISVSSNGDNLINSTETKILKCTVFNGYNNDVTTDVSEWKVVRHTEDANDDETWNNNHISFDGELSITSADIGVGEKASFVFTVVMADGLQTTTTVVIRKVLSDTDFGDGYSMEIDTGGDSLIAYGETKALTCKIYNSLRKDVTKSVLAWQVVRDSGDKASDTAWLLKDKVKAFGGTIDIVYSNEENDLGTATSAKFIFTATIGEEEVQAILEI